MLLEQEPMMLPDTAGENLHQLSPRAAETLVAKRGELFGIRLSGDQGLQHAASASAHDVRDYRTQFDVRLLQNRLDALYVLHNLARQLLPRPGQIAQLLDRGWRHEASTTSTLCTSRPAHRLCNVFIATSLGRDRREALAHRILLTVFQGSALPTWAD